MAVLTPPPDARGPRRDPLGGPATTLLVVVSLWLAAACMTLAARAFATVYPALGAALPAGTRLALDLVAWHVPWTAAALASLAVVALRLNRSPRFAPACAVLAVAMMGLLAAQLAMLALPLAPCGELSRLLLTPDAGCGP